MENERDEEETRSEFVGTIFIDGMKRKSSLNFDANPLHRRDEEEMELEILCESSS
ncbi:hypothetical protein [Fredinandcohnia onubensis]|uniref:hypothetical protein n=1 Tax=Fredinandcohnia onubensis TaxID=1571209 RepID=UPI0015D47463|nr:hypothetical protein [Fredinandcohnia onubensis]